jgi:predicted nucleic acid-binding protein
MCIEPTSEEVEIAWQAFDHGDAGQAGIVDHVSFILMRRLKISRAFTNDVHYLAAGFETCW